MYSEGDCNAKIIMRMKRNIMIVMYDNNVKIVNDSTVNPQCNEAQHTELCVMNSISGQRSVGCTRLSSVYLVDGVS